MSKSRMPMMIGLTAAGGMGYYLYSAGGDPKVAQKQAEADAHRASSKIQSELPLRGKEYEKDAEKYGAQAGAKVDGAFSKAQSDLSKAASDAEAYARDAKNAGLRKVDELDRKVEDGASKAKSGIGSWFGGGGGGGK